MWWGWSPLWRPPEAFAGGTIIVRARTKNAGEMPDKIFTRFLLHFDQAQIMAINPLFKI
jgi:hypothetical protein